MLEHGAGPSATSRSTPSTRPVGVPVAVGQALEQPRRVRRDWTARDSSPMVSSSRRRQRRPRAPPPRSAASAGRGATSRARRVHSCAGCAGRVGRQRGDLGRRRARWVTGAPRSWTFEGAQRRCPSERAAVVRSTPPRHAAARWHPGVIDEDAGVRPRVRSRRRSSRSEVVGAQPGDERLHAGHDAGPVLSSGARSGCTDHPGSRPTASAATSLLWRTPVRWLRRTRCVTATALSRLSRSARRTRRR